MKEPDHDPPTYRAVRKGQPISVEVIGGFVQRPAPEDGIAVDWKNRSGFIPTGQMHGLLSSLERRKR